MRKRGKGAMQGKVEMKGDKKITEGSYYSKYSLRVGLEPKSPPAQVIPGQVTFKLESKGKTPMNRRISMRYHVYDRSDLTPLSHRSFSPICASHSTLFKGEAIIDEAALIYISGIIEG
jgi:hypothetical protein